MPYSAENSHISLPAYILFLISGPPVKLLFLFFLGNILSVIYLFRRNSRHINQIRLRAELTEEKINILTDQNSKEHKNKLALQEKIRRYDNLKEIVGRINQDLSLESVADNLASIAFSVIADNKGTCVFYLVDKRSQALVLFKTRKEDKKLVIKAKQGDVFDYWVLRHSSPLVIEDVGKDFRFDLDKVKERESRPVNSLISAPFMSTNRFLGILRLDSPEPYFYNQDDLRFMVTVCDLGAVALENGEYFEEAQDLAIHDELTSLFTKGYFLERLKQECKRSARKDRVFSLLMLDIDHFKDYNDKFGHIAGDTVLKNLGKNIIDFLKDKSALISRFGGEEFCVILYDVDKKKACGIADDLRSRIGGIKTVLRNQETTITVSIGVVSFPVDSGDEDDLIFKADRAMYQAKEKGRNRVVCI